MEVTPIPLSDTAAADPATRVANQLSGIAMNLEGVEEGLVRFLTGLQASLENVEMHVQVVNKPVPGMQIMLEQLTHAYDETLLPLLKSLHHKLGLDEDIWRQVTESRKLLKKIDQRILAQGATTSKRVKPLRK